MALKADLADDVRAIFKEAWETRDGTVVPEPKDLKLSNDAVKFDGAVLYADLDGSTSMVDAKSPAFSAEVYKAYLHCCAKLIRDAGGIITAYDGDRIMAVFIGDRKCSRAVRCGLQINWAVKNIINPVLKECYPKSDFQVRQVVGIDTGPLFAARIGIRGGNDLVWVGSAANYAAKLTSLSADYPTRITQRVFKVIDDSAKYAGEAKTLMWESVTWKDQGDMPIYRSAWSWAVA